MQPSLVRDTKKINVALRDLDSPQDMDVNDYTMTIEDHNARILWDNSLDESRKLIYTPHATWNTVDEDEQGKIAHADFMTSRILKHEDYNLDGRLLIKSKETGNTVVNVDLPGPLESSSHQRGVQLQCTGIPRPCLRLQTSVLYSGWQAQVLLHHHQRECTELE